MSIEKTFEIWDRGDYTYDGDMEVLRQLKDGQKVASFLTRTTMCPVGKGTCASLMKLELFGYHPEKKGKKEIINLCSIGVTDQEKCPLNK